jgi:hypothetical protein
MSLLLLLLGLRLLDEFLEWKTKRSRAYVLVLDERSLPRLLSMDILIHKVN